MTQLIWNVGMIGILAVSPRRLKLKDALTRWTFIQGLCKSILHFLYSMFADSFTCLSALLEKNMNNVSAGFLKRFTVL